ncbi:MAG: hypothetical protein P9M03_11565, partial [Candidatus Theseobacter exili]|nr:hypothetical protein [Candidatus Theseobacter exili]
MHKKCKNISKEVLFYLSNSVLDVLRAAIDTSGGREVFFLGEIGNGKVVENIEVLARGTKEAVPIV